MTAVTWPVQLVFTVTRNGRVIYQGPNESEAREVYAVTCTVENVKSPAFGRYRSARVVLTRDGAAIATREAV